jgi:hypothetical protein
MGDEVMRQPEAWTAYDRWQQDDRVDLMDEPSGLEEGARSRLLAEAGQWNCSSYCVASIPSAACILGSSRTLSHSSSSGFTVAPAATSCATTS